MNVQDVAAAQLLPQTWAEAKRQKETMFECKAAREIPVIKDADTVDRFRLRLRTCRQHTKLVTSRRHSPRELDCCSRRPAVFPGGIEIRSDHPNLHPFNNLNLRMKIENFCRGGL